MSLSSHYIFLFGHTTLVDFSMTQKLDGDHLSQIKKEKGTKTERRITDYFQEQMLFSMYCKIPI